MHCHRRLVASESAISTEITATAHGSAASAGSRSSDACMKCHFDPRENFAGKRFLPAEIRDLGARHAERKSHNVKLHSARLNNSHVEHTLSNSLNRGIRFAGNYTKVFNSPLALSPYLYSKAS